VRSEIIEIETAARRITDLTDRVREFCSTQGDGLCHVFVPHATAGLALIEVGAGSDEDLDRQLDELFPRDNRYTHRHGSPGHGADHLVPAFVSPSLVVPVEGGRVMLGTWQSVVLVDTNIDNPRRCVRLSFVGGQA
jgi:secondary thiamine-phosphate synthase enzyme